MCAFQVAGPYSRATFTHQHRARLGAPLAVTGAQMPRTAKPQVARVANRVLDCLSDAAYRRIAPHLKTVELVLGEAIYERNAPLRHVYFPSTGMVSMIAVVDG